MSDAVRIRRLVPADMAAAAKLHRASFDERLPWLAGLHTPEDDENFWSGHVFPTCQVWAAEVDGGLVGVIAFREGWVDQLYVLPDAQRRGIGTRLLDLAKSAYPQLQLWTFQRNLPARRFYAAHGFAIVEETDGSRNEEKEPDVLYRWEARLHRL